MDPSSPYWLASALGLNAAGNTGSNLTSLPPLVIHSMDYFTDPDYLKPKDEKNSITAQCPPTARQPTTGVSSSSLLSESVVQTSCKQKTSDDVQNRKKKRFRIVGWQLDALESQFAVSKMLTQANQQRLQIQLNISGAQIRTWYKHRRQRERQASGSNEVLANTQLNQFSLNTDSSNQSSSRMLLNNQHLQSSSTVTSPQYYSSSTSSHQSSLSPQSSVPFCNSKEFFDFQFYSQKNTTEDQLETLEQQDENDDIK